MMRASAIDNHTPYATDKTEKFIGESVRATIGIHKSHVGRGIGRQREKRDTMSHISRTVDISDVHGLEQLWARKAILLPHEIAGAIGAQRERDRIPLAESQRTDEYMAGETSGSKKSQSTGMVIVAMRDEHGIDGAYIDPGGKQVMLKSRGMLPRVGQKPKSGPIRLRDVKNHGEPMLRLQAWHNLIGHGAIGIAPRARFHVIVDDYSYGNHFDTALRI